MATIHVTELLSLFRGFDQRWPKLEGGYWPSMGGADA